MTVSQSSSNLVGGSAAVSLKNLTPVLQKAPATGGSTVVKTAKIKINTAATKEIAPSQTTGKDGTMRISRTNELLLHGLRQKPKKSPSPDSLKVQIAN